MQLRLWQLRARPPSRPDLPAYGVANVRFRQPRSRWNRIGVDAIDVQSRVFGQRLAADLVAGQRTVWYSCRNTPTPRGSSRLTHDLQDRQRCELCAKPARKRPSVQPTDAYNLFKQTPVGGAGFTRGWPLMKQRRAFAAITLALLIVTPAIAWEAFKPVRILAPTLNGVTCVARVCVQETADLALAQRLQNNALEAVGRKLSPLERAPLTVFCSTRECYQSFGGGLERGAAILDWGVSFHPSPGSPTSWSTSTSMRCRPNNLACWAGRERHCGSRKACHSSSVRRRITTYLLTRVLWSLGTRPGSNSTAGLASGREPAICNSSFKPGPLRAST